MAFINADKKVDVDVISVENPGHGAGHGNQPLPVNELETNTQHYNTGEFTFFFFGGGGNLPMTSQQITNTRARQGKDKGKVVGLPLDKVKERKQ